MTETGTSTTTIDLSGLIDADTSETTGAVQDALNFEGLFDGLLPAVDTTDTGADVAEAAKAATEAV